MHRCKLVDYTTLPDAEKVSLRHKLDETHTSQVFFSQMNVDALQGEIVRRVSETAGRPISRQSDFELLIVMRSIYLQYSNNDPATVVDEVRWLNGKVLDFVIPNVMSNIIQFQRYMDEIGKNPIPIDHARSVSSKGNKSLSRQGVW